jgi:hypothetical protein
MTNNNSESDSDTDTDTQNITTRSKSWSIDSRSYSIDSNDDITLQRRKPSFEIIIKIEDTSSNDIYTHLKQNMTNSIKITDHKYITKRRARDMNISNVIAYSPPNINEYFKTLSISNNKHK